MAPLRHHIAQEAIFQTLDGTTRLFTMPYSLAKSASESPYTFWQLSMPMPEAQAVALKKDRTALRAFIEHRCAGWHAPIPDMLASTVDALITATPIYDREVDLFAPGSLYTHPHPHMTFIGDAIHPMSPFKGQGANQALLDAVELCEVVVSHLRTPQLGPHLRAFERDMHTRSIKIVLSSRRTAVRLHCDDAEQAANSKVRGLTTRTLELFEERACGAWDKDLRDKVREVFDTVQREGGDQQGRAKVQRKSA